MRVKIVGCSLLIAYFIRKMDKNSNKFTTLIMDTGEEKAQFGNYLEHQAQQKKR